MTIGPQGAAERIKRKWQRSTDILPWLHHGESSVLIVHLFLDCVFRAIVLHHNDHTVVHLNWLLLEARNKHCSDNKCVRTLATSKHVVFKLRQCRS